MTDAIVTRDDYFKQAGDRESILRAIDSLVQTSAPHFKPVLFEGMSGTLTLGYGLLPYKTKSMKTATTWPVVSLVPQKNYISLYIMAVEGDEYVAEKYKDTLGKVSVGKSCIRFKKLENLNQESVAVLLRKLDERYVKGENIYGAFGVESA